MLKCPLCKVRKTRFKMARKHIKCSTTQNFTDQINSKSIQRFNFLPLLREKCTAHRCSKYEATNITRNAQKAMQLQQNMIHIDPHQNDVVKRYFKQGCQSKTGNPVFGFRNKIFGKRNSNLFIFVIFIKEFLSFSSRNLYKNYQISEKIHSHI